MHCRAKRSKIPDDVGFNYDEFDEFVGTGTPDSAKKGKKAEKDEGPQEPQVEWHVEDPPPDPTGPLPDILSFASPMVPGNRIEEAKALQLQRAWARATWAEVGEFPDRDSMVGNFNTAQHPWDESPPEFRKINEEEYGKLLAKYLDTVARAEDTYPEAGARASDGPAAPAREVRDAAEGGRQDVISRSSWTTSPRAPWGACCSTTTGTL